MKSPKILEKLKNAPADKIGNDVYVEYHWVEDGADWTLTHIFFGSKKLGPMLVYEPPQTETEEVEKYEIPDITPQGVKMTTISPHHYYDGFKRRHFPNGAWTVLYSRGDYGRRYASGGHYTAHIRGLHPRIMSQYPPTHDKCAQILLTDNSKILVLPEGVQGEVTLHQIDVTVGWTVFFDTPREAITNRLTPQEIVEASLSPHLTQPNAQDAWEDLLDVIEAYDL